MADKNYKLTFTMSDGTTKEVYFTAPQGPAGENGKTATVKIGTVETLDAGSNATVTNSGTATDAVLNFGIPRGADGAGGEGTGETPWYKNKKVLFLGDSITASSSGWVGYFNSIMQPSKSVNIALAAARFCDYNDTVYDGNPSSGYNSGNVIGNQVEKILRGKDSANANYSKVDDYAEFDIIIISAGTNDTAPSGDFESTFISESAPVPLTSLDKKNFASAVRYAVETLQTLYPNAIVFICTPIQAHEKERSYADTKAKRNYLIEVCERMSVPYIDAFMCGISGMFEVENSSGRDLRDGLHPNAKGAEKLARYISKEIMNYVSSYAADVGDVDPYTNQVEISIESDGTAYNGGLGYKNGYRIRSAGTETAFDNAACSGFIPIKGGDIVRISGFDFGQSMAANAISAYNSSFAHLGQLAGNGSNYAIFASGGAYSAYGKQSVVVEKTGVWKWVAPPAASGIAYIRLSAYTTDGSVMLLTINEEI